jgi:hypothetical protein
MILFFEHGLKSIRNKPRMTRIERIRRIKKINANIILSALIF